MLAPDEDRLEREARRWSAEDEARQVKRSWLQSPVVLEHVNRRVSGEAGCDWLQWVKREFLSQTSCQLALSLGCNDALFERQLVAADICHELEGIDISAEAIARAQAKADREGLRAHFAVGDVNTIQLTPEHYDVVFAVMAMHHFVALEHILSGVNRALKPGGLLLLNEYVGASRFRWPESQLRLANEVHRLLPPHRRQLRNGSVREVIKAPDLAEMDRTDPFEAIRSAEIIPVVQQHLEIVARRDYGGSILHPVLHDIIHNFDETLPGDRDLLHVLCGLEEFLLRQGQVSSDFTVIVARKKPRD